MKQLTVGTAAVALALSASVALAAPCNTGATKGKSPDQTTNEKSSDTDKSSKNTAGGQQPGSPGTVGAMNNAGTSQGVGKEASNDKGKEDPGAKNEAGGKQPASPGTVGAMNNTGSKQDVGKDEGC